MSDAIGRASGKVILFGEHAVVYGVPAIAAGIDRGAQASARATAPGSISTLELGGKTFEARAGGEPDLGLALHALLTATGISPTVHVQARADLPPGGGLGCSAALGVAIGRAVCQLTHQDDEAAQSRAVAWEGVFHGNPSGVDTAAAALGGCLRYVRGEGIARVSPARDIWLAIGQTGVPSSTRAMVEGVARIRDRQPEAFEQTLTAFRTLVDNARLAIESGDMKAVGQLMDLAQMLLSGWMLSTEAVETLCRAARDAGALGAKLTGAGGGGCIVSLADDAVDGEAAAARIVTAYKAVGLDGFVARVSRRGGTDGGAGGERAS